MEISQRDHQAQWDAETLAEANSIESNPDRLERAKQAAKKLAEDQKERADCMQSAAVKKGKSGQRRKGPQPNNTNQQPQAGKQIAKPANSTNNNFNVFKQI